MITARETLRSATPDPNNKEWCGLVKPLLVLSNAEPENRSRAKIKIAPKNNQD
jgi:hypothetical protein